MTARTSAACRKRLVDAVMAVPGDVRHIADVDAFRFATLCHLLRRRDLRLISVWHPSFLELLLDTTSERWHELTSELAMTDPARRRNSDALARTTRRASGRTCGW